jgi:hypothetical protein
MATDPVKTLVEMADPKTTDKGTVHSYLEVYDELFAPRRYSARRVLEVGVLDGGSIWLWQQYFKSALVYAVDCSSCAKVPLPAERVRLVHSVDAYTQGLVQSLSAAEPGGFDVLLDDGAHSLETIKFFASAYPRLLAPQGVLVIEDVQDPEWFPAIRDAFPVELRPHVRMIDRRGVKGRFDDILIVLDKATIPRLL